MHFNSFGCKVEASNGEILALALLECNLYQLDTNVVNETERNCLAHCDKNLHSWKLWHKMLGHLNTKNVILFPTILSDMNMRKVQNNVYLIACKICCCNLR